MSLLKYIGIPYVVGKESFDEADCYGICRLFAQHELNIELPQYMYSTLDNEVIAEKAIAEAGHSLGTGWSKISKDTLQLGDIVTFRIMGHETHCGIMIDKYQFLHTLKGRQSCIEELSHINWVHRHTGSFRWKNKN